jgi:hypothetical protein
MGVAFDTEAFEQVQALDDRSGEIMLRLAADGYDQRDADGPPARGKSVFSSSWGILSPSVERRGDVSLQAWTAPASGDKRAR